MCFIHKLGLSSGQRSVPPKAKGKTSALGPVSPCCCFRGSETEKEIGAVNVRMPGGMTFSFYYRVWRSPETQVMAHRLMGLQA